MKATLVEIPLTECALRGTSLSRIAPALEMTSLKKNEMAFLEIGLAGFLGETNKEEGLCTIFLVFFKYILRALTGQRSKSSVRSPAKSFKESFQNVSKVRFHEVYSSLICPRANLLLVCIYLLSLISSLRLICYD